MGVFQVHMRSDYVSIGPPLGFFKSFFKNDFAKIVIHSEKFSEFFGSWGRTQ